MQSRLRAHHLRLTITETVEHDFQLPPCHLRRIKLLDRARRQIARVGIEIFPCRRTLGIDALKLSRRQINLSANLHHARHRSLQSMRQRTDRAHVRRHIVSTVAFTPRHGPHQLTVFVGKTYSQAVDLRFDRVVEILDLEQLDEPRVKRPDLRLVVTVVEAQHLLPVRDFNESLHPVITHPLGR